MSTDFVKRLVVVGSLSIAASSCAGSSEPAGPIDQAAAELAAAELAADGEFVEGSGDARLPFETFSDWVSYADAVVEVKVTDVRTDELTDAERKEGAGLQGRRISVEISDVLWQHRSSPELPQGFEFFGLPYVLQQEKLLESRSGIAPWMDEGETFIVPITSTVSDGWIPLNIEAVVPLTNGVLMPVENIGGITTILTELTPRELTGILDESDPDPVAERNRDLDVDARFLAVIEGRPELPPAEGES